jgi:hypothetical protein
LWRTRLQTNALWFADIERRSGALTMPLSNDSQRSRGWRFAMICALAGMALSACGLSNGPGQFMVEPGMYDAYRCNDLIARWGVLNTREQELRENMTRASQSGIGTVIGAAAYSTEYQSVLTQKKMVQQNAAGKNCELVHSFQSDQTIR